MQKVFCFGSFFLFQVYRYKPLLFRKKKNLKPLTPLRFARPELYGDLSLHDQHS